MSKNALLLLQSQKSCAFMSSLASSCTLVVLRENPLLCQRLEDWFDCHIGVDLSQKLSGQVSDPVVADGWQSPLRTWPTLKASPHGQCDGSRAGCHSYRTHKASLKACLCRLNP